MKYCLYCTCMGTLASSLKEEALRSALGPAVALKAVDRLCDNAACRKALEGMAFGPADTVVAAACSKGSRGAQALACLRSAAPGVRAELADIREACVWPGSKDSAGVDAQAADLVRMGFARLESAAPAEACPRPARACSWPVPGLPVWPPRLRWPPSASLLPLPSAVPPSAVC